MNPLGPQPRVTRRTFLKHSAATTVALGIAAAVAALSVVVMQCVYPAGLLVAALVAAVLVVVVYRPGCARLTVRPLIQRCARPPTLIKRLAAYA